ncbi:MAG: hypothetical protein CMJ31_05620 [Phycisphaerae bacterium]|nr:hypothetical protein [Phycisphaerae bacterium]
MHQFPAESRASSRRVELVLDQVDRLPTLSPIAMQLLALGSADEVDIDEVVDLISSDPALTAMILGLCRRADKGITATITTVKRAVVLLGLDAVRSAVLSVTVYELISDQAENNERIGRSTDGGTKPIDRAGLWKHAIAVACCAELLAEKHTKLGVKAEEAFVAGLLHDVGRLVLDLVLPKAVARVHELAERRGSDSAPVERQLIGIDHHTAGRRVAQRWGLPIALQDVMWRHGQPFSALPDEPHRPLIGLVTLAKSYCRQQHLGWSGDFSEPRDPRGLARDLDIPANACEDVLERLIHSVIERSTALKLDDETNVELLIRSVASANSRLARLNAQLRDHAEASRSQTALLAAMSRFAETSVAPRRVSAAAELVTQSAADLLGQGYYAIAIRTWVGEPWRVYAMDERGRHLRSDLIESWRSADAGGSIAGVTRGPGRPVDSPAADAWLVEILSTLGPPQDAMVLPLVDPHDNDDPMAMLIHNRRGAPVWRDTNAATALVGVWGSAIRAAAAIERADATSESLSEVTRELTEAQSRMAEHQSLARLGELTAGAAHELNTPLAVAQGRAELLLSMLEEGSAEREQAERIADATHEVSLIVSDLHELSSNSTGPLEPCDIGEIARDAADRASATREHAGRVTVEATPLAVARGDRELLVRALTELVANAIDAAPDRLVRVTVHIDRADSRVIVSVMDQGPGFSERALLHGFDPFFSEKPAGRGRGMGLARVRRSMDLIGGNVTLGASRTGGACVTIALPLHAAFDADGIDGQGHEGADEAA